MNGWIYIFGRNREISLDEELALAKKKKQETIEKIEDIIQWSDSRYRVDQINLTLRNCEIYGMIFSEYIFYILIRYLPIQMMINCILFLYILIHSFFYLLKR